MAKPTIGTAVTPAQGEQGWQWQEARQLVVLEEGSSESIFSLVFGQGSESSGQETSE